MSEYQEFTGRTVEEAIRAARESFGVSGLDDLDFEILTPGSRGVLGMGAEPARIIAAPRTALSGGAARRDAAAVGHPAPAAAEAAPAGACTAAARAAARGDPQAGPRRARPRGSARPRSRPSRPAPTPRCRCAARVPTGRRVTTVARAMAAHP